MWGAIDIELYEHYNNPINGSLHIVVPGKFIAFQGPHDLGELAYLDDQRGCRSIGPAFVVQVLLDLGVSDVIRLNEPCYDPAAFTDHGLRHHDMEFPDCTPPPDAVAAAFLRVAAAARGAVAVHCKAGLGRTGTLIALYMMKHHGFTARAAMGWLRIVRPGSVIGDQQRFLCAMDAEPDPAPPLPAAAAAGGGGVESPPTATGDACAGAGLGGGDRSPAALARQVSEGMRRNLRVVVAVATGS